MADVAAYVFVAAIVTVTVMVAALSLFTLVRATTYCLLAPEPVVSPEKLAVRYAVSELLTDNAPSPVTLMTPNALPVSFMAMVLAVSVNCSCDGVLVHVSLYVAVAAAYLAVAALVTVMVALPAAT